MTPSPQGLQPSALHRLAVARPRLALGLVIVIILVLRAVL